MKKYISFLLFFFVFSMSSCLESGLDELPTYDESEIKSFNFQYRWYDGTGQGNLKVTSLNVKNTVDKDNRIITCEITVPGASATLPEAERAKVSLKNLVGYCELSTAATIEPVAGSPKLGSIDDFSGDNIQYKVIAADKSSSIWTLKILSFTK